MVPRAFALGVLAFVKGSDALVARNPHEPLALESTGSAVFPIALDVGPWELKADMHEDAPTRECHTDSDCDMDADTHFRCMRVKDLPITEGNKCRIAGMSQKTGEQACLCSTMLCSRPSAPPKNLSKIQYLMLGDCIMYTTRLRIEKDLEEQGWEIATTIGNVGSTNRAVHCVDSWLQNKPPVNRKWDVISFNMGLHDVAFTTEHLTLTEYTKHFSKIVYKLVQEQKRSGTKLLWVSTTPAPDQPTIDMANCTTPSGMKCLTPARHWWDIEEYNAAAEKVLQHFTDAYDAKFEILDLHSHITNLCGGSGYKFCSQYQKDYNAHFLKEGYDMIAEQYKQKLLSLYQ